MVDNRNPDPAASSDDLAADPGASVSGWRAITLTDGVTLAAVIGALGWAYLPNIVDLSRTWNREPDYSHGWIVLPIALFILYRLWPTQAADRPRVWLPGFAVVILGVGLRAWFHSKGQNWSETFSLLLVVFGLGLARLGWRAMRRTWPAFAYLLFWFPLPPAVNNSLSQPLQSIATSASVKVLRFSGLWVMSEGNVLMIGKAKLEVATACNGLSMLMSLSAAVVAAACLIPMPLIKRLVLLATIVPIALISNILRISATAWCYHQYGEEIGSKYAHDWAGYLMMPMAMALVGLELAIMSMLVVESRVQPAQSFAGDFSGYRQPNLGEARR